MAQLREKLNKQLIAAYYKARALCWPNAYTSAVPALLLRAPAQSKPAAIINFSINIRAYGALKSRALAVIRLWNLAQKKKP